MFKIWPVKTCSCLSSKYMYMKNQRFMEYMLASPHAEINCKPTITISFTQCSAVMVTKHFFTGNNQF